MSTTTPATTLTNTSPTFTMSGQSNTGFVAPRELRAPPFSQEKPSLWFAQLLTEVDKYNRVIPLIDTRSAAEVESLIINMPATTPYQQLKTTLISCFSRSREATLLQLLDRETIGDRTPSQYWRHLKSLVPDIDEEVLKTRWLSHLPEQTKACLVIQERASLDDQAKLADKLQEAYAPNSVAAVANTHGDSEISQLTKLIAQLTAQIASTQTAPPHTSRRHRGNRSSSRRRSRSQSRNVANGEPFICFYHSKFGNDARKCQQGCNFQGNEAGSR